MSSDKWICAGCLKEFRSERPTKIRINGLPEGYQYQRVCRACFRGDLKHWNELLRIVNSHEPMIWEMIRAREKAEE